ncbi:hypothetical protein ACFQV2_39040 [Actinokineospora soli]|uniref:Uncharacterized protein n=1 Tax=Actinokineospora soli TaxID=1048753 RepID=A0ABW2TX34_9PSEU
MREPGLLDRLFDDARRGPRSLAVRARLDPRHRPTANRAVLVWQIRRAIEQSTRNPEIRELLVVAYHLTPGGEPMLEARLENLAARRGRALSTLQTKLSVSRAPVRELLKGDLPSRRRARSRRWSASNSTTSARTGNRATRRWSCPSRS